MYILYALYIHEIICKLHALHVCSQESSSPSCFARSTGMILFSLSATRSNRLQAPWKPPPRRARGEPPPLSPWVP